MTDTSTSDESPGAPSGGWRSRLRGIWPLAQFVVSVFLVAALLAWLLQHPAKKEEPAATVEPPPVKAVAPMELVVRSDSPLGRRLAARKVAAEEVTDPILQVTGVVIASRRPGKEGQADFWQFHSVELLTTYAAWQKAVADEQFAKSQLEQIRELAGSKEAALQKSIDRLQKLVRVGTESERDLVNLQTELKQAIIQNRKDVYQAETAVKTANRDVTTQSLQLRQSGLEPDRLINAPPNLDVISAEVPEALLDRVALGQSCRAKFVGIPSEGFLGQVKAISPVLSSEQRTLRVLIDLDDPRDRLRPGMFASIGLGTDPRRVIRIPASSLVHVARKDYVFVQDGIEPSDGVGMQRLRAREVVVEELIEGMVEVREGISEGTVIVSDHAILLKPVLLASQRLSKPDTTKVGISDAAREGSRR